MKNPSKVTKKFDKIVGGALIADDSKNVSIPPKKAITMSTTDMFLNGEMDLQVNGHTGIKENGEIKARVDNDSKYPRILVSKKLTEKASMEAVQKYMEEKDITSIKEIINVSEKDKASKKTSQEKVSGGFDR